MKSLISGMQCLAAGVFCVWIFGASAVMAQQAVPLTGTSTGTGTGTSSRTALEMPDYPYLVQHIWTHLVALQQANASGNYQVFHSLGAPGFQKSNPPQRLVKIFANLRAQNVDLTQTLTVTPIFTKPPLINKSGFLHMQGRFPLRPLNINFEVMFQLVNGQWRMFGISVNPTPAPALGATAQPGQNPSQQTVQNVGSTGSVKRTTLQTPRSTPLDFESYLPGFLKNTGFNPWILLAFIAGLLLMIIALVRQAFLIRRHRNSEDDRLEEYYDLNSENMFVEPRMPPPA